MRTLFLILIALSTIQSVYSQKTGILFADSEMKRFPKAYQLDHGQRLYFGYSQGLGCQAMLDVWKQSGDK